MQPSLHCLQLSSINGLTFVRHPVIQRLSNWVSRRDHLSQRPSLHTATYDVMILWCYVLSRLWQNRCLLSCQRSQTLSSLGLISHMFLEENRYIFYIPTLLRQWHPGFNQEALEFKEYTLDVLICAVRLIKL